MKHKYSFLGQISNIMQKNLFFSCVSSVLLHIWLEIFLSASTMKTPWHPSVENKTAASLPCWLSEHTVITHNSRLQHLIADFSPVTSLIEVFKEQIADCALRKERERHVDSNTVLNQYSSVWPVRVCKCVCVWTGELGTAESERQQSN